MDAISKWIAALGIRPGRNANFALRTAAQGCAILLSLAGALAHAQGYTVTQLGAPAGYQSTYATAISSNGYVTGDVSTASVTGATLDSFGQRAFLYSNGTMQIVNGDPSVGYGVNDSGEVVGGFFLQGYDEFGFPNGSTPYGGAWSVSVGINNAGQFVGWEEGAFGPGGGSRAYLYDSNGTYTDLGFGQAFAINNNGTVLGVGPINGSSTDQTYLYSNGTYQALSGFSAAQGSLINDSDQILAGNELYSDGSVQSLSIYGLGLNDGGVVVGYSDIAGGAEHAFLSSDGQAVDLNSDIGSAASLYTLVSAVGISDSGQIAVNGVVDATGQNVAFLLTPESPVPLPPTVWLLLSSLGALGIAGRRQLAHRLRLITRCVRAPSSGDRW